MFLVKFPVVAHLLIQILSLTLVLAYLMIHKHKLSHSLSGWVERFIKLIYFRMFLIYETPNLNIYLISHSHNI